MSRIVFFLLTLLSLSAARAAVPDFSSVPVGDAEQFLPVAQVFRFSVSPDGDDRLALAWKIAPGYALYKARIDAMAPDAPAGVQLAPLAFSSPTFIKNDPSFGPMVVFHDEARAELELTAVPPAAAGRLLHVQVRYQGCADAGLCYPPQTADLTLPMTALKATTAPAIPVLVRTARADTVAGVSADAGLDDAGGIAAFLHHAGFAMVVFTFFLLGVGLTFTPCVFPMLPILSGLIAGEEHAKLSTGHAFRLSLAYVTGMASTYALAGTLVGYFGARANVALWLQTPVVLVTFALVFVALALSMFGFYELQLPAFVRDRLDALSRRQRGGRFLGVFIMGVLSALVVSPCVSAPLAGTLVYIGTTGNAVLGGVALLALGFGMGAPLVLIGTTGGRLLPRAGNWMLVVKAVFGVGLLAVAIWLVGRVLPGPVTLALWALLVGLSAIAMGALEPAAAGWPRVLKGVAVLQLMLAGFLLAGALTGQEDPLHPLAAFARSSAPAAAPGELEFTRVTTTKDLQERLAAAAREGRQEVVDVYADWCVACKAMQRTTFRDPAVIRALASRAHLQLDLSANTGEQRQLLQQLHLYGPPAMLFYDASGHEQRHLRVQSEISASALLARLDSAGPGS